MLCRGGFDVKSSGTSSGDSLMCTVCTYSVWPGSTPGTTSAGDPEDFSENTLDDFSVTGAAGRAAGSIVDTTDSETVPALPWEANRGFGVEQAVVLELVRIGGGEGQRKFEIA